MNGFYAAASLAAADAALQADLAAETSERAGADTMYDSTRAAVDTWLNGRISMLESLASVHGQAPPTRLLFAARAAEIADIGSDGTTLTILTIGAHGMADGDYVDVIGTDAYDGVYGPIDVVAGDELHATTTIPATAHEAAGTVRTEALRVESATGYQPSMWVEVVNDVGAFHASPIASVSGLYLHLEVPIPVTWDGSDGASVNRPVMPTPLETVLARTAAPGSEDAGLSLPAVIRGISKRVPVEFFGADPFGTNDSMAAFTAALAYVAPGGGIVEAGGPGAVYRLASDIIIPHSHVLLDGNGALIHGTSVGRLYINGDSGTDGDWSAAVYDTHIRNWRIGDSIDDDLQIARGPRISWGIDCSMSNIVKTTRGGTGFAIDMSKGCTARDIVCRGASAAGGAFGFLIHLSDDTLVERLQISDGPFYYGLQSKGGTNNVVKDAIIRNVVAAGAARTVIGFRDRGNAPYKAAGSSSNTLTYPYPDIGWGTADPRRASIKTKYINCHVFDSTLIPFACQEGEDADIIDCSAKNCVSGITLKRTEGSIDARLTVAATTGATSLTIAMEIDDETGLPADTWHAGQSVVVELNSGAVHVTTAAADQVGHTLTLTAGMPSAAAINRGVGRSQTGAEKGYKVRNFRESGGTAGHGINIFGAAASYLPGVTIESAELLNNFQSGVNATYTDRLTLVRVKAGNNNQAGGTDRGINVQFSTNPKVLDCVGYDDQTIHTQQQGITIDPSTCTDATMRNSTGYGNTVRDLQAWLPGSYSGNLPGEGFGTTTDATPKNDIWRCQLQEGQLVEIDVVVIARRTNGNDYARYALRGTYKMESGVVTAVAGPISTITDYETQAAYACSLQISGTLVRVNALGMAGHTINWTVQARTLRAA